mmetsp:Transcript_130871/g.227518  ORF Transcript_130871/g.227518 Transcript_130871/m.227518 type:complete len:208 (-) Transcript_130871:671-1294(-)
MSLSSSSPVGFRRKARASEWLSREELGGEEFSGRASARMPSATPALLLVGDLKGLSRSSTSTMFDKFVSSPSGALARPPLLLAAAVGVFTVLLGVIGGVGGCCAPDGKNSGALADIIPPTEPVDRSIGCAASSIFVGLRRPSYVSCIERSWVGGIPVNDAIAVDRCPARSKTLAGAVPAGDGGKERRLRRSTQSSAWLVGFCCTKCP